LLPRYLAYFRERGLPVFAVSAVSGEGIAQLVAAVGAELEERRRALAEAAGDALLDSDPPHG
jgi:putative protein kinase ArgK-like GTPase of G3E family